MTEPKKAAGGVQDLISRIRDEGVQAGRSEAERLVAEARQKADGIVAAAEKQAAETLDRAHEQLRKDRDAGMAALRTAARDTGLELRQAVLSAFEEHVRRLVTDVTTDVEFLRALVLVVAGRAAEEFCTDKHIRIMVGHYLDGELDDETLERERQLVLSVSSEMLRDGVELIPTDAVKGGARVQIIGENLEIDLSDAAITSLLLAHMLPRFRSILTGVEKER